MKQSYFEKHGPCSNCHSRDNLAHYSDGGAFCFGCGFVIPSKISGYISADVEDSREELHLPPDSTFEYGQKANDWYLRYGLNASVLISRGVMWSPSREQLIYTFWDSQEAPKQLLAYQARTFKPGQPKYINRGDFSEILPIYPVEKNKRTKSVVIVEDCLSALKVANIAQDAMPCLKSDLNTVRLTRLAEKYDEVVIWLDQDMYHKALAMQDRLQWLGSKVAVIQSTGDPKDHRYSDISKIVNMSLDFSKEVVC